MRHMTRVPVPYISNDREDTDGIWACYTNRTPIVTFNDHAVLFVHKERRGNMLLVRSGGRDPPSVALPRRRRYCLCGAREARFFVTGILGPT